MLVIYEAVKGMTKIAKGAIRLPYDHLSANDAFEVLAPGPQEQPGTQSPSVCGHEHSGSFKAPDVRLRLQPAQSAVRRELPAPLHGH